MDQPCRNDLLHLDEGLIMRAQWIKASEQRPTSCCRCLVSVNYGEGCRGVDLDMYSTQSGLFLCEMRGHPKKVEAWMLAPEVYLDELETVPEDEAK